MFKKIFVALAAVMSLSAFAQVVPTTGATVFVSEKGQFTQQATFTTTSDGPALIWVSGYRTNIPYFMGYKNVVFSSVVESATVTDVDGNAVCTPAPVPAAQPIQYKWTCSVANLPAGEYTITMEGATMATHGPAPTEPVVFSVVAQ